MQEQSFEQMLNDSMKDIKVGEVIKGKVISVSPQKIALNIGYKADGIITRENYSNDQDLDLTTCCKIGDEMEVKVKKLNDGEGQVVLSRRDLIDSFVKNRLKQIVDEGKAKIQKGKVIKITSGGLVIHIKQRCSELSLLRKVSLELGIISIFLSISPITGFSFSFSLILFFLKQLNIEVNFFLKSFQFHPNILFSLNINKYKVIYV